MNVLRVLFINRCVVFNGIRIVWNDAFVGKELPALIQLLCHLIFLFGSFVSPDLPVTLMVLLLLLGKSPELCEVLHNVDVVDDVEVEVVPDDATHDLRGHCRDDQLVHQLVSRCVLCLTLEFTGCHWAQMGQKVVELRLIFNTERQRIQRGVNERKDDRQVNVDEFENRNLGHERAVVVVSVPVVLIWDQNQSDVLEHDVDAAHNDVQYDTLNHW